MEEKAGKVFRLAQEYPPVPGCTISKEAFHGDSDSAIYFSLAEDTDISAEIYRAPKLWIGLDGDLEAFTKETEDGKSVEKASPLLPGSLYVTPAGVPVGIRAKTDGVYMELELGKDAAMNKVLKAGNVFALKDLLPYQDGRIVNMDLINQDDLKFVLMSFDAGTGLSEHAAPGEAIIFALDGEAVIGYEGKEYRIKAGENFKFDKLGRHSITADHKFKMGLLLQLA